MIFFAKYKYSIRFQILNKKFVTLEKSLLLSIKSCTEVEFLRPFQMKFARIFLLAKMSFCADTFSLSTSKT